MKFNSLIKQYEYRCKTCNTNININEALNEHINHDIRARQRLKYFLLEISANVGLFAGISATMFYFFMLPELDRIVAICKSVTGVGSI